MTDIAEKLGLAENLIQAYAIDGVLLLSDIDEPKRRRFLFVAVVTADIVIFWFIAKKKMNQKAHADNGNTAVNNMNGIDNDHYSDDEDSLIFGDIMNSVVDKDRKNILIHTIKKDKTKKLVLNKISPEERERERERERKRERKINIRRRQRTCHHKKN